jgi:hypothetical protein
LAYLVITEQEPELEPHHFSMLGSHKNDVALAPALALTQFFGF